MSFGAAYLNIRCFIDGLEVPVIGVKTNFTEGQHPQAQVQLIYTSDLELIKPRAAVMIYVYENDDFEGNTTTAGRTRRGSSDLRRYKLLFAGEYLAISAQRTGSQRMAVMVCYGATNYFDIIKQHYVNYTGGAFEQLENAFLGIKPTSTKFSSVPGKGVLSQLYGWLVGTKDSDGFSSMIVGVQRTIREMFFSSNFYFARAFNRWRFGDLVVGLPGDVTASKLFKIQFFQKWIRNQTQGGGGMITLQQLILSLLGMVFCTHVTVPCPYFDPKGTMRGFSVEKGDPSLLKGQIKRTAWPGAALHYTIIKPDSWFFAPPVCNVVFPNQYNAVSYQRDYGNELTRLFVRTQATRSGGFTQWAVERFYAPDFKSFGLQSSNQGSFLRRMASILLPHEEFVGLNPQFTWMSDIASFIAKTPRRQYLSYLADHMFWKMRFGTRSANVSGPLNLNIVPGHSAVVLSNDAPASTRRHIVGYVASVSHSIDQTGGHTHYTLVGARYHDEDGDFDGEGRPLEEVATRAQEGFYDERYLPDKIGPDYYRPMFGCDSVMDQISISSDDDLTEVKPASIKEAAETLAELYDTAQKSGVDLALFSASYTWRPKANLVELIGIPGSTESALTAQDSAAVDYLSSTLGPEYAQGFWATLVDPDAPDTDTNDAYTATTETTVRERQPEEFEVVGVTYNAAIDGVDTVRERVDSEPVYVTRTVLSDTQSSYGLRDHLLKRQHCVSIYLDSLRYRGMKG